MFQTKHEKIDPTEPLIVVAFICAFMGDFGSILILPHYIFGFIAMAIVWPKIHGGLSKIILLIAFLLPGPILTLGIILAILATNKFLAFLIEQVAIQALAVASGGLGELAEGAAGAELAGDVAVTAGEAAMDTAEAGANVAEGAADLGDAAENATDRAKDLVDKGKQLGDRLDGGQGQSDEDQQQPQESEAEKRRMALALGEQETAFEEADEQNFPKDIAPTATQANAENTEDQDPKRRKEIAQMERTFQDVKPPKDRNAA